MKFFEATETALDYLYNIKPLVLFILGSNVAAILAAGYNPMYAVFGTAGQLIYLGGRYVQSINKGKGIKSYPALYIVITIALGASVAFLGTPQLIKIFPSWDGFILSTIVGALAQKIVDFLDGLYSKVKKDGGIE